MSIFEFVLIGIVISQTMLDTLQPGSNVSFTSFFSVFIGSYFERSWIDLYESRSDDNGSCCFESCDSLVFVGFGY